MTQDTNTDSLADGASAKMTLRSFSETAASQANQEPQDGETKQERAAASISGAFARLAIAASAKIERPRRAIQAGRSKWAKKRSDWLGLGALAFMLAGIVAPSTLTLAPASKAFLATLPDGASETIVAIATASLMMSAWGLGRLAARAEKRARKTT